MNIACYTDKKKAKRGFLNISPAPGDALAYQIQTKLGTLVELSAQHLMHIFSQFHYGLRCDVMR